MKKILIILILSVSFRLTAEENIIKPDNNIFKDTMVEMTWQEVKKAAENGSVVLFPIAVVEEHGPHMDLSPDIYQSCMMSRMIKQELSGKKIASIIAPPYYWGINVDTGKFPGSFTVKNETFKAMLIDSCRCLKNWGFTKIFFVNYHGDKTHNQVLNSSIFEIRNELDIEVYEVRSLIFSTGNNKTKLPRPRVGKIRPDVHAGADETATMWAFYPEKVREKEIEKLQPQSSFEPLGYFGDPASYKLDKENSLEFFKILVKDGADAIEYVFKRTEEIICKILQL